MEGASHMVSFFQSQHFDLHLLPGKCYTLLGVVTDFLFSLPDPVGERFRRRGVFFAHPQVGHGGSTGRRRQTRLRNWEQIFCGEFASMRDKRVLVKIIGEGAYETESYLLL